MLGCGWCKKCDPEERDTENVQPALFTPSRNYAETKELRLRLRNNFGGQGRWTEWRRAKTILSIIDERDATE